MKTLKVTLSISLCILLTACNSLSVSKKSNNTYTVKHISTATVLLKYGNLTILTDPALDGAGGSYDNGFAVLKKTKASNLSTAELPHIDLVLLSHGQHYDNLDRAGRKVTNNAPLTITTEDSAKNLSGPAVGLKPWQRHTIGDVTITAVPAQHGPKQAIPVLGTVIGFIISSSTGPTVYISGDTVPFSGTDELVKRYAGKVDFALIHTGSVAKGKEKLTYFTMKSNEAVNMAKQLNVTKFSLIHNDSWEHFREKTTEALAIAKDSTISGRLIDLSNGTQKAYYSEK